MRKARTPEDDLEFLYWLIEHEYKQAMQSKWRISEGAARGWMARIRNRYRWQREQVNKITGLMHRSDRIKRMMLKACPVKQTDDEDEGDIEPEVKWKL